MKRIVFLCILLVLLCAMKMKKDIKVHEAGNFNILKQFNIDRVELEKNGFYMHTDNIHSIEEFYKELRDKDLPIFVSADAVMHIYHALFSHSLREKELNEFIPALERLLKDTLIVLQREKYKHISSDPSKTLISYLKVAQALLTGSDNGLIEDEKKELALIKSAVGFEKSRIFKYLEDYSQYKPRGHYTSKEELSRYFQCMMYLGRMTFMANADDMPEDLLNRLTAAALILTGTVLKNTNIYENWKNIFNPINYLIGFSDDLTIEHYSPLLGGLNVNELTTDQVLKVRESVKKLPSPKIYSGLGDIATRDSKDAQKKLSSTQGLRLFGQRFVLDSFLFSRLVFPYVGKFQKRSDPITHFRGTRRLPSTLDLIASLSFPPALDLLNETDNSAYDKYLEELSKFQRFFRSMKNDQWNSTLYLRWIHTLNALFGQASGNDNWNRRLIRSFQGSFAQLRHDTLLYVKQSYTMRTVSMPPQRPPERKKLMGYPENNVLFWERFINLCEGSENAFSDDYGIRMKFNTLSQLGRRMKDILLRGINESDLEYFHKFPDLLEQMIGSLSEKTKRVLSVADIHTDSESGNVLQIGVGGFSKMFVIMNDKDPMVFIGPVFNFYEFKMPFTKRLTNDEFDDMLKKGKLEMPEYLKWK